MSDTLQKIYDAAKSRLGLLIAIAILVVAGNFAAAVFFNVIEALYRGDYAFTDIFQFSIIQFAAIGAVPIICVSLVIEARLLGWEKSSIRRLFESQTLSCRTDIVYATLYCAHLLPALGLLFSLGTGYYVSRLIETHYGWSLLRNVHPAIGFAVQCLIGPLVFYWVHRIEHTRFFWEFHKVHHAADQMTMVNNFRNHPFTWVIRVVLESVPAAMLGIPPVALFAYVILAGIIVVWQHSDCDWNAPWLQKYILIGAAGHRIHHSREPEHYNKNLGFVVFWDWLFGTLYKGEKVPVRIGIEDSPLHNKNNPFHEMWTIFTFGLATLGREFLVTGGRVLRVLKVPGKRGR